MSIVSVHTPNMVGDIKLPAAANKTTIAGLQGDLVYGNSGTGPPANGAAPNDAAWPAGWRVALDNATYAKWNGTAWALTTPPLYT